MTARKMILALLFPISVFGQAKTQIAVQRVKEPIVLDGLSNESAWQEIQPLPLTMYTPIFQGEPTEKTELRIAYDDDNIYVSGRFYDSDPSSIQANSVVRDLDRGGDFLNILLDTFNDKQNFVGFFTTPGGNRLDREVINDAEGSDPNDFSWNSYWDCEVVQNDQGWFVEMRIPFSSLRFQDDHGRVVFGLTAHRLIARKNERLTFPAIRPKTGFSAFKASEAQEVVFEGIYRRNPMYFSPYGLAGNDYATRVQSGNTSYTTETKTSKEVGFDLKYGFANNMTLDVTANTDFAQVEADDQQINLTRFSLFYPERRQFFQERSGVFDFRYAGINRLFHSRKIGLTDAGEPVRILGGARLVGRFGPWDMGLIDMQTETSNTLPSENFNIVRFRRNVFNNDSYVGMMETGRLGSNGNHNIALGFDGFFRLSDADYFLLHYIQGFQSSIKDSPTFDQSVVSIDWQRRTSEGFGGNRTALYVGDLYDPGIGYNQRRGGTELSGNILYGWFENDNPVIRKHTPAVSWSTFLRNGDRTEESGSLAARWTVDFKSGASASLEINSVHESVQDTLEFAESVHVMPGDFGFQGIKISYSMSPGSQLRSGFGLESGRFYDGSRFACSITPTWNISRYCEVGGEYQLNRIRFPVRGEQVDASILRVRIQGALNQHFSISALSQYSNVAKIIGNGLRCRYNFREGVDVYLVYNNVLWVDRNKYGFTLPALDRSTLILKYVYTFSS